MFVILMKLVRMSDLVQESVKYSSSNRLPWVWGSVEVSLSCAPKDHLELGIVMNWILKPLTAVNEPTAERCTFMVGLRDLGSMLLQNRPMYTCLQGVAALHVPCRSWGIALRCCYRWFEWKMHASARDKRSCSWAFRVLLESQGFVLAVAVPVVRDERNK